MDPLIGASLVNLGGGLLNAAFSPSVKKQLKWQRESQQQMSDWNAGRLQQIKPKLPYYQNSALPQLGSAATSAVMGNLMQRLGPETLAKWGIAMPAPAPAGMPAPVARPNPQAFAGADVLRKRYGV